MSWLQSIQKLTRRLVGFLENPRKKRLVSLIAFLVSLGSLIAFLVSLGSLATPLGPLVALAASLPALMVSLAALMASLAKKEKNEPSLILPPGANLRAALHFIYPPKTAERVFDQIIADMRVEWIEATKKDQQWLARWIQVRGVLTVFLTVAAHAVTTLGGILKLVR